MEDEPIHVARDAAAGGVVAGTAAQRGNILPRDMEGEAVLPGEIIDGVAGPRHMEDEPIHVARDAAAGGVVAGTAAQRGNILPRDMEGEAVLPGEIIDGVAGPRHMEDEPIHVARDAAAGGVVAGTAAQRGNILPRDMEGEAVLPGEIIDGVAGPRRVMIGACLATAVGTAVGAALAGLMGGVVGGVAGYVFGHGQEDRRED